jgi:hypothetical protein
MSLSFLLLLASAVHVCAQANSSSGYRVVNVNGKFGYADANHIVIRPQFDFARPFFDGMAAVAFSTDRPPQSDCSCGAVITMYHFKWGFINEAGELAIQPQWGDVGDFSEGLASVNNGEGFSFGKWGYISKAGVLVIGSQFDEAGPFVNGKAPFVIRQVVKGGTAIKFTRGYVDRRGKIKKLSQHVYQSKPG